MDMMGINSSQPATDNQVAGTQSDTAEKVAALSQGMDASISRAGIFDIGTITKRND